MKSFSEQDPNVTGTEILDRYRRLRQMSLRVGNQLVKAIPKDVLDHCGQILGFTQKGILVFETEDETSVLMDYCIYYPQEDGRNVVSHFLERSPPRANSDEMAILQAMARAYYSLFRGEKAEPGVGVHVRDMLRDEAIFIADVGFSTSAIPGLALATRVIPGDGFFMTGGAAVPVDRGSGERILRDLSQKGYVPGRFDFKGMSPQQEADVAAIIIRACRATGASSHIMYRHEGERPAARAGGMRPRKIGRNEPCPCGSGRKFKHCCGLTGA
jgi:hypothetical protein